MHRPLRCGLIGIGARARKLYLPILKPLAPWIEVTAVCTPDAENARSTGAELGVPAFSELGAMLDANLIEAAIVLSNIESHHAISVTLSRRGIHQLIETTMASTLAQARQMVEEAQAGGATLLVAENYFRFPFDRLAKAVARSGAIGDVYRISCLHDQVGFHGHARWMKFYDAYPVAVQSIAHRMPTARHVESANRIHEYETFRSCHLFFPDDRVALDMGGNLKGMLGRMPRPGYTEIDGTQGAISRAADADLGGRAELRIASESALARGGRADHVEPFVDVVENGTWISSSVRLPDGLVEVTNPLRPGQVTGKKVREWDAAVVMEIVIELAEHVRAMRPAQFTAADALKATEIEMACRESALRGGERIALPTEGASFESEAQAAAVLRDRFGIDPLDAPSMLAVHFPPAA